MDALERGTQIHKNLEEAQSQLWFYFTHYTYEELAKTQYLKYLETEGGSGYTILLSWIKDGFDMECKNCDLKLWQHANFVRCLFDNHDFVESVRPGGFVMSLKVLKLMVRVYYDWKDARVFKIDYTVVRPEWAR